MTACSSDKRSSGERIFRRFIYCNGRCVCDDGCHPTEILGLIVTFPYRIVDLTHQLSPSVPSYDGTCGFSLSLASDYDSNKKVSFRVQELNLHAGIGTHIDAPAHCINGGAFVDDIPIHRLISPCSVIDVSEIADEHFVLLPRHVTVWENGHKPISAGTCVIVRTGWDRYFHNSERYRNNLQFPTISEDAARILIDRGISGLGIDTLSPDLPTSGFPVHDLIFRSNKYIIENVAHADRLPSTGSYVFAVPLKFADATEAPIRLLGMIKISDDNDFLFK